MVPSRLQQYRNALQAKEAQARQKVTVRWDVGLNKKHLASFTFARDDASELRLMTGALLVDMLLPHACIWLTGCHCGQKQQLLGACMLQAASFLLQISSKCSRGCLPQLDSALSSCATSA